MKSVLLIGIILFQSFFTYTQVRENNDIIVKSAEKKYKVSYPNGNVDVFVFVFKAHVTSYMEQGGSSSSFTHPVDTRRCSYRVNSYIKREGFFLTGSGKRIPLNDVQKIYGSSSSAIRNNSLPEQVVGQHSPCNDYVSDFENRKLNVKNAIINAFDTFLLTDIYKTSEIEAEEAIGGNAKLSEK